MKIYEIGTGYTSIPARMGAATEIVVEELTKAFLKQGQKVEIIDIASADRMPHQLPLREVRVPKCFTGTDVKLGLMHKLKRVVYSVALAGELKKILKKSEEKVILHFHNQYNLFFFLKLTGKKVREKAKVAYTVHSYIWPEKWEKIEETVKKRYFQEIYCVQNADYVFTLNEKTAEHFTDHLAVSESRIYRINNGVNTDVYHIQREKEVEEFKKAAGLTGKRMIFQVGSVCDRKNQLGAVKMLREYLQKHSEVIYVYAGGVIDVEYHASLMQYAKENDILNQVCYAGELCPGKILNQYYNAAEVTIFPSKLESFGLVIIESLCAGTPVILADRPLFELNSGYYVYQSDEEFMNLVDSCADGQKKGIEVRAEVERHYSWDSVAEDYLRIWRNEACS